jgi:hypothetical protein
MSECDESAEGSPAFVPRPPCCISRRSLRKPAWLVRSRYAWQLCGSWRSQSAPGELWIRLVFEHVPQQRAKLVLR